MGTLRPNVLIFEHVCCVRKGKIVRESFIHVVADVVTEKNICQDVTSQAISILVVTHFFRHSLTITDS